MRPSPARRPSARRLSARRPSDRRPSGSRRLIGASAALLIASTGLTAAGLTVASPAQAAIAGLIATPNGMVGVPQQVLVRSSAVGQTGTITFQAGAASTTQSVTIGSNGFGSVQWTPTAAGPWTITAGGAIASSKFTNVTIASMPTSMQLLVPHVVQAGVTSPVIASVTANIGALAPQGSVSLQTPWSTTALSSATLGAGATATNSTATIPWASTGNGYTSIKGVYAPTSGGQLAASGPVATPIVTTDVPTVTLRLPQVFRNGQAAPISAVLGAGVPQGTVAFFLDDKPLTASIATRNGVASTTWTPTDTAVHTIGVEFSSGTTTWGVDSVSVRVLPPLPADGISVNGGWGANAPAMTAGTGVGLGGAATSGATVLFTATGPCVVNATTLMALGAGTCTLTATSPGSASYGPGSATYSITISPAPRR